MNKIERAIYDIKLHIEQMKTERLILDSQINSHKRILNMLEGIKENIHIPNETPLAPQTN